MNPQEVLNKYNITVESEFVPFSQSRFKHEKSPSLNWKVTVKLGNKALITTNYMAGCGHCPSYNQRDYKTVDGNNAVKLECEKGKNHKTGKEIKPDSCDVVWSLMLDSDVLNYESFEDWAAWGDFWRISHRNFLCCRGFLGG